MKQALLIMMFILGGFVAPPSFGQTSLPETALSDGEIDSRAKEVGRALRCVVCQNQSIEESDASLAEDMRTLVRARIRSGDSNDEVITYMQNRYGDFVLLKPPVQANTYLLWSAPFLLMILGIIGFYFRSRKTGPVTANALSEAEHAKLNAILDTHKKTRQ